jgi:hypothetical protein
MRKTSTAIHTVFPAANGPRCKILLLCAFTALLVSFTDPPFPAQKQIEQTFRAEPISEGRAAPSPNSALDVYIDGSQSMQGFTQDGQTNFTRKLRLIVDQANNGLNPQIICFSTELTVLPDYTVQQLLSPSFYKGLDTPLSTVLNRIADNASRMAIVISDMVQSDAHSDEVKLSRALTTLMQKKLQIELLAFRSSFNGDYYIENLPKKHGRQQSFELHTSESLPDAGRPFYVLAVGPDRPALQHLEHLALHNTEADKTFSPADPPLTVENVAYAPAPGKNATWVVKSKTGPFREESGRERSFLWLEETAAGNPPHSLRLRITGKQTIHLANPYDIGVEVRKATYRGFSPLAPPTPTDAVGVQAEYEKDAKKGSTNQLIVTYRFPEPPRDAWDIYEIKLSAGEGNLDRPEWVEKWSTTDDRTAATANQTFQLAQLVDTTLRAITEKVAFSEQYIALRRR